jgi:WD40 repeat protein
VQRLVEALRRVVLPTVEGRVVLFLDEIDVAQSLPFSANEFFAAIRHCYTRRAEDPEFERLSFCLAGVATPSDLIDDPLTTPFNIGTRIELTDFEEAEATRLAEGLGRPDDEAAALIHRVLHWTSGHPYLTQRMCQAVQADEGVRTAADVDKLCEELFFSERAREQEPNLQFVRNTMLWRDIDHAALLGIYGDVVRGRHVPNDETNPLTDVLRLAGIVRVDGGRLTARNAIYEHVFDRAWVRESMPDAELRRQRVAARRAFTRTAAGAAVVVALLAAFAWYAVRQEKQAVRIGAMAQADKGRMMLRDSDVNGLLYLAEARKSAEGMPELAASIAEEWALWHWQLDGRLLQVFGHDAEVTAMAFSPDGRLFVTGAADGTAQLWDTVTGKPHGQPLVHGSRIGQDPRYHAMSPTWGLLCFNPDATLVVASGEAGRITVWNTLTTEMHRQLRPDEMIVEQMAFAADGDLVACAYSVDDGLRLWRWDMRDGSVVLDAQPIVEGKRIGRVVLDADAAQIVALTFTGLATVDAETGETRWFKSRNQVVSSAVRSDGFVALGYFARNEVEVFDSHGASVRQFSADAFADTSGAGTDPAQVEVTQDGKTLLTVTHSSLRLWDFATGAPRGEPILHDGWIVYRSFSADSRLLAGAYGSTVLVWDTETGQQVIEPLIYSSPVKGILFHPTDPHILAVQSVDRSVRLWNVGSTSRYRTLAEYPGDPEAGNFTSSMVAFSPTAPLVATSNQLEPNVVIRNVETGELHGGPLSHVGTPDTDGNPREAGLNAIAFSPDGSRLAAANATHGIYLWDVDRATLAAPVQEGVPSSLAFAPDGSTLAWLRWRNPLGDALRIWDMEASEPVTFPYADLVGGYVGDPGGVDFDSTGDRVLLVRHQGRAAVFGTRDMGQVGRNMLLNGRSDCARWSPDDSLIVTSSEDASAQLWDATTQRPVGPPMSHRARVRWANFSLDGTYVATASDDRTAQLWDVATGKRVGLPLRHTSSVLCIEFSPDGRYVATAATQDARLWKLPDTPDALEEVQRKTALATGQRLDGQGAVEPLAWREWQALRAASSPE